ncbi:unnamed protein product [Lymnaea stagnalis]|uniref:Cadherin domain-containing protein n=1 Tax=Lymnaea stagnalis TaxID=6523 RepID=A0AAV2I4N1_LYMST
MEQRKLKRFNMTPRRLHCQLTVLVLLHIARTLCQAQDACQPTGFQPEVFLTVLENVSLGHVVYKTVFTADSSLIALSATIPNTLFAFDGTNRTIYVNGSLDAELRLTLGTIEISCSPLPAGSQAGNRVRLYVEIQDVNDNSPVFTNSVYNISVGEMTQLNASISTNIKATDADVTPEFNILYYSIIDGPFKSYFFIKDPLKSEITLLKKLDFETLPLMNLTIMAQDQPQSGVKFNSTCLLIIRILDEDDQNPVFNESLYRGFLNTSMSVNSTVTIKPPIAAYDPDITLHAPIVFSFHGRFVTISLCLVSNSSKILLCYTIQLHSIGKSESILAIDPITAVVTLVRLPTASEVYLLVQATQTDNPSRYGVALLAIQVQGSNVNAPVFSRSAYNVVVSEVFPKGTIVTSVLASDADSGSVITYSMADPTGHFYINSITGDIILTEALSYVNKSEYLLHVSADDGTFKTTTNLTISVWPVNKSPPKILTSNLTVAAERNSGDIVITIKASAEDKGAALSYRILTYNDLFEINNKGEIMISSKSELLTYNSYPIAVVVSDGGQPSYETSTVVTINFPSRAVELVASAEMDVIPVIILGVIAGVFLIIIIILIYYICRRRLRHEEPLDRVKKPGSLSHNPRALTFKQKQGTLGRTARMNIDFSEEISDGDSVLQQDNPLNISNKGSYYNFINVDSEAEPSYSNEIQVETTVIPFSNPNYDAANETTDIENTDNNSQGSGDSDDYSPRNKDALAPFYRNGSLSTYRESSDSDRSFTLSPTEVKKILMPGSLAQTKVPEENGAFWDESTSPEPTSSSEENIATDLTVPGSQKQELTVYF